MDVKERFVQREYGCRPLSRREHGTSALKRLCLKMSSVWKITIGFSRPWDLKRPSMVSLVDPAHDRSYKVPSLNDASGKVVSHGSLF